MSEPFKITIYGNIVVKYQEDPALGLWEGKKNIIDGAIENLVVELHDSLALTAPIGVQPSYHQHNLQRGTYYYKIELKYPSITGTKELIEVDK